MRTCVLGVRILVCLAIFFVVFSLSCRRKSPEETDANRPDAGSDAAKIAAIVNGVDITESELKELIKPQLDEIARQAGQLPPTVAEQYKERLRQEALDQLIRGLLLDEKAREANITVTEEEVISQITEIASAQKPPLSLEDFKKKMAEYGRSFDDAKQEVRTGLSRNKLMEVQWAGKINVTEDDARKYYDENQNRFETPEQVRASHILVELEPTAPGADPNEAKARAKAKAQELLKQIKDGGADLAELAKAHSACLSAPDGGDLDFIPRGQTPPAFEKAAFELEVGQISDVVETEYGYHIIKATDHKDAGVISFEQAKDNVIKLLTQEKQLEFTDEYIKSLKAKANIVLPSAK
jgi:peptidyl-prolyl cis-trans isomerase C